MTATAASTVSSSTAKTSALRHIRVPVQTLALNCIKTSVAMEFPMVIFMARLTSLKKKQGCKLRQRKFLTRHALKISLVLAMVLVCISRLKDGSWSA
ncbi:Wall-associated kinase-like protein [Corchorus olitorius]|uniref:Wall-associated kinase-like protein n=1 Tax=Corchorus olitorius TaxID=93759 RepID=A0A1R3K9X4_9ROSI|nr:Wall-associated kinase-like protein [Corchorus olitorius]